MCPCGNGADTLGNGAKAEGGFIAFCALSDSTAMAKARGLRGFIASAVAERSKGLSSHFLHLACMSTPEARNFLNTASAISSASDCVDCFGAASPRMISL